MEDRQKIIEKLVKIKALAERGIGGEQQTAQVMYATLKEKYKVTDAEIEKAAAVPVDISEIDLKKFWGIAFQLAAVAKTLQEETKAPEKRIPNIAGAAGIFEQLLLPGMRKAFVFSV